MGSIRKAPRTGRWEARYRDPYGAQRSRTFARQADAKAFLAAAETDMRRDDWLEPEASRLTLRDWHTRWWATIDNGERAANTLALYETMLRLHVLPHLGDRKLTGLRRIDIEEWLATLRRHGLGQSGQRTARMLLRAMLSSAVESRVIRSNPTTGIKASRKPASRAKQALTVAQVEALAEVAGEYRVLVLVLAYCGLRPNEAFALRRHHRDDFGQLVIEEGLVEVRGELIATDGKTHRSRVVPIPRSVAEELTRLLADHPDPPDGFMFTTSTGRPIRLNNFRRYLDGVAVAAGLPEWFTPYTLRHTCASLMAQQGVPVTTAAAIMGHDPAEYLRTYAHLYPDDMRGAAALLDAARTAQTATVPGEDVAQHPGRS